MGLCLRKVNIRSQQSGQELQNKYNQLKDQRCRTLESSVLDTINTSQNNKIQNNYTLLCPPIGQGAFSEIRKAIHKPTGLKRAVKIFQKSDAIPEEINRILNEVEILKRLDHPFILKILDFYQDSRNIYIVTEYCEGGELFDVLMKIKSFSEKDAAKIMKQIFSAIYYCHSNKIVHRDIKLENILLDSTNQQELSIKIIDFGTSKFFDPKQKLKQKLGTPYYIAPEVLKQNYDEKCDIWSCGVILYILLCGFPPFNGSTDSKIIEQVSKGIFDFKAEEWEIISEEGKSFIRKLLVVDPQQRYSAQLALEDPWFKRFLEKQSEDLPEISKALNNMRSFKKTQRLSQTVYQYIVNQFATSEEKKQLLKTFQSLDLNNDGLLSSEELLIGLKKIMVVEEAEQEVKRIMSTVDTNNSGKIDYTEFLAATINRQNLISVERLEIVFKQIDTDGNGTIEIAELKQFFGNGQIPVKVWKQLILEVDENQNEVISYQQFCTMMLKLTV